MGKKVVFLEFADESRAFFDYCEAKGLDLQDFHLIALQPEVQVFLKKNGILYENTLDYFPNGSHKRALLKSEDWLNTFSQELDIHDGTQIKEAYNNSFLFNLRYYINYFLMHVEILSNICANYDVESIYTFSYQNKFQANEVPIIQENERFIGLIVKNFCEKKQIKWEEIPNSPPVFDKKTTPIFLYWLMRFPEKTISSLYKFLISNLNKNKKAILFPSLGYNMEVLSEKLKPHIPDSRWVAISAESPTKTAFKFLYFRISKLLKKYRGSTIEPLSLDSFISINQSDYKNLKILEGRLKKVDKIFKKHYNNFNYNGIYFLNSFSDKIKRDLTPYILTLFLRSIAIKKIIEDFNVKLCISPLARDSALLTGELCRIKKIPTLIVSHGTLKIPENKLEEIEYKNLGESLALSRIFEYAAVQTPNENKVFQHFKRKNSLKTGPLLFSMADLKRKVTYKKSILGSVNYNEKVLFYPENSRQRINPRFRVFETFDEFLSSTTDLVNSVNEIDGVHLVIRLHPMRKINSDDVKSLLPESEKVTFVSSRKPFFETLSIADLVIGFSSTAIEEALQSYIPVLLFDKKNRYMHFQSEKIELEKNPKLSPIYYVNNPDNLKYGIQWILENHLNKQVPRSIFYDYKFSEDYFQNLVKFIDNKVSY